MFRQSRETKVHVTLAQCARRRERIATGVPFFDHLLQQMAAHSGLTMLASAVGDCFLDKHHVVEDVGIAVGATLTRLQCNLSRTNRYGCFYAPLDETLAHAVVDFSGRPTLSAGAGSAGCVCSFNAHLVVEFFRAVSRTVGVSMHVDVVRGLERHHRAEAVFKAFGRAMRHAIRVDARSAASTKGFLASDNEDGRRHC
ncbi:Imidazoleglycerol-phosphate dehydratase [Candidatus Tremblaya princeps]|uniref:Imidazoleglycerol-phosphate dehydratase n=1 Tax=Tremblaya princeps TaxID=189385 RepID=A0A143WNN5_TREPR|nr:Imidazoleglycerol-phosphate dehydratase [Candidatus Tremblaya princeps]